MTDRPRLIEYAFPLKQTSLDSVHEKNVRHGHISTLHIWPARRPLAACRAALIATLLPDPSAQPKPEGMSDDAWHEEIIRRRRELCEKIGGKLVKKIDRKKMPNGETVEREKEQTVGGILHWGRETENKDTLEWFRQEIKKAYGGLSPKVLDPFAGGGAIPLEAMRLGCKATAVDINPVAWFILKCTLEYPQKLAGKTHPLPDFILKDEEFMDAFYKAHPHLVGRAKPTKKQLKEQENMLPGLAMHRDDNTRAPKADLAWHVRAWGRWVLDRARRELARFYPTYADFEAFDKHSTRPFEKKPMKLVALKDDCTPDVDALNAELSKEYLGDKRNPRWVAKPTVAYLWARTVKCKNCRATLPLLKTRWLCKKDKKRVILAMKPSVQKSGVVFGIETNVPVKGGNAAQRREHDKRIASGTMSRSGAKCPCCSAIMTMEDIRLEGKAGRLSATMTAVVLDGHSGKEYRLPVAHELTVAAVDERTVDAIFASIPTGHLEANLPLTRVKGNSGFRVILYGIDSWRRLLAVRQYAMLGAFSASARAARESCLSEQHTTDWGEAIGAYLGICVDRLVDSSTTLCHWQTGGEFSVNTLQRFALPMSWDFSEVNTLSTLTGSFGNAVNWVGLVVEHCLNAAQEAPASQVINQSSTTLDRFGPFDLILTDPPYYDAIAYSDVMDLFYCWLRATMIDLDACTQSAFHSPIGPKWDSTAQDGELIDDPARFGGDAVASKKAYETGMAMVFRRCRELLVDSGRFVVVFANKHPEAWETLVSAMISAGFVVDGSWPIQTERATRSVALNTAALASSVWLVCKKRPATARPGWDNQVLEDMRRNIREKLREFWDAGIRGPDFVWAATGPALEAYSKHPVVKKANEPGPLTVSEFLTHVRRMVVDFVVGRVLSADKEGDADTAATDRLDEPTAYYLLHRHDFGMDEAPAGACILYAISCGISDRDLSDTWNIVGFTKGKAEEDEAEEADADAESDAETDNDSGSKVKLKTWAQRKGKSLGYEAPGGKPIPLIDRVHCLMHLWKAGDLSKVDGYLDGNGLRRQELFKRLLQSLIELSPRGSEERSLLESLSNHVHARGAVKDDKQAALFSEASVREAEEKT